MAEPYLIEYTDKTDRLAKVKEQEGLGRQMLCCDGTDAAGGVMTFIDPIPPTAEEIAEQQYIEQIARDSNDSIHAIKDAYDNWDNLTSSQQKEKVKDLLACMLNLYQGQY